MSRPPDASSPGGLAADAWCFPFCPDPGRAVDWPAVEAAFPWLRALAGCPQDPVFHAEGDVLVHTRMVCDALVGDERWAAMSRPERGILFAAALLHDVAKPLCTVEEDGRISSKGHAVRGTHIARRELYTADDPLASGGLPAPFAYREQVCGLVRHHGLPLTLLQKDAPERAVILASQTARCDWLALLAEADVRGRVCAGDAGRELLDRVALFREFAREHRCESAPRPFPSDHSRVVYFESQDRDPDYLAFDDTRCEVVVLSGLPGAGKDHWRRTNLPDRPVVSLDALREEMEVDPGDGQGAVVGRAKEAARELLRAGASFVWSATNVSRHLRRQVIGLLRAYRARVRVVYVEAPYRRVLERNRRRSPGVPAAVIERLINRLDVPDATESHAVEYVVA